MYKYRLELKDLTPAQLESIGEICLKLLSAEHKADTLFTLNITLKEIPKCYEAPDTERAS
jgi:hypothetical protein